VRRLPSSQGLGGTQALEGGGGQIAGIRKCSARRLPGDVPSPDVRGGEIVYLNANEHPRSSVVVATRDAGGFVADPCGAIRLHRYEAPRTPHVQVRGATSKREIESCAGPRIAARDFPRGAGDETRRHGITSSRRSTTRILAQRAARSVLPADIARAPIPACCLRGRNDQECKAGGVLIVDVAGD